MAKKVFLMSLLVAGSCFAEASLFKTVGATNDVLSLWSRFSALLTDKNPTNDQASAYQVDEVRKGDTIQFKLQGVAMRKKFAEDSANEEAWQQFGIAVMEAAGRCETYRGTLVMPEEFDSDEPVSGNRDWILRIRHDVPATGNPQDREIVHFWAGYKSFQCQNIRD